MKAIFLLVTLLVVCSVVHFYFTPALKQYKSQADAQAYHRVNLLEDLDLKDLDIPKY